MKKKGGGNNQVNIKSYFKKLASSFTNNILTRIELIFKEKNNIPIRGIQLFGLALCARQVRVGNRRTTTISNNDSYIYQ